MKEIRPIVYSLTKSKMLLIYFLLYAINCKLPVYVDGQVTKQQHTSV